MICALCGFRCQKCCYVVRCYENSIQQSIFSVLVYTLNVIVFSPLDIKNATKCWSIFFPFLATRMEFIVWIRKISGRFVWERVGKKWIEIVKFPHCYYYSILLACNPILCFAEFNEVLLNATVSQTNEQAIAHIEEHSSQFCCWHNKNNWYNLSEPK